MLYFKEITEDNFWKIISLKIKEGQSVAPNVVSIAQSKVNPEFNPFAIYKNEILIGFIMYTVNKDEERYEIDRLMIDENYQRKGYGKEAMEKIIKDFKQRKEYNKIVLSVAKSNIGAIEFYKNMGFNFNGELVDDEDEMELII